MEHRSGPDHTIIHWRNDSMATPILSDLFEYDPESKTGLRSLQTRGRSVAGRSVGTLVRRGSGCQYYYTKINKRSVFVHRLVWELIHGEPIPAGKMIDHIDGNGLNNRIENLRLVDTAGNARNRKLRRDSTTGIVGVSFQPSLGRYIAHYTDSDGTHRSKHFYCKKLGADQALKAASEWRDRKIREVNAAGAGYTERHLSSSSE